MSRVPGLKISLAVGVLALLAVAGGLGYLIGHHNRGAVFTVEPGIVYATPTEGTAYLGANQPHNLRPKGFAYFFPPTVATINADGAIQGGGQRPPCVPYYHVVRVKEMEAVIYPISGGYQGTVVWVRC